MSRFPVQLIAAALCAAALMVSVNAYSADIARHAIRTKIAGIDVILYPTQVRDVVTLVGSLPAGNAAGGDDAAIAALTGAMLDKGTESQDKFAIARSLDQVGARVGFLVGAQTLNIEARSLRADAGLILKVLAEELRHPGFSPEELAKAKLELAGHLQQQSESTEFRAKETFLQAAYTSGHPNRPAPLSAWKSSLDAATLNAVKNFHKKFYGPSHMVLVLVGDLDIPKIKAAIERNFTGWSGGADYVHASRALNVPPHAQVIVMPGKTSVTVLAGEATSLRFADPDALALRVGVAVLGQGFTSRLMGSVRDREGLTYHTDAGIENDSISNGDWRINASFAPSLLDQGVASTLRELRRWYQGGVTAQELEAFKGDMIGSFQVSLTDTGGMAEALLRTAQRGLPLSWMDDYPKQIQAVTLEQVNGAIKRYVDPDRLVIIKAGSVTPGAAN